MWSPKGASICELPVNEAINATNQGFSVQKIKWNPRGNNIMLMDKVNAIMAFPGMEFMTNELPLRENTNI